MDDRVDDLAVFEHDGDRAGEADDQGRRGHLGGAFEKSAARFSRRHARNRGPEQADTEEHGVQLDDVPAELCGAVDEKRDTQQEDPEYGCPGTGHLDIVRRLETAAVIDVGDQAL